METSSPPKKLPINFFDNTTAATLANAIIITACKDYQYILCGGRVYGESKRSLEAFFKGEWFSLLARNSIDPDALIKYLNDNAKENNYNFEKIKHAQKYKQDWSLM